MKPVFTSLPKAVAVTLLGLLFAVPAQTRGQQRFVHANDITFSIRSDRRTYAIGDEVLIHYTIKNVSNAALYVPANQWEITCGTRPHLWSAVEDSSGKHYEPGYASSCGTPSVITGMRDFDHISERMRKDAIRLNPGQAATGSFSFDTGVFAKALKPGRYRLEGILYGWNQEFSIFQLSELARMGAPFLVGESSASSTIELRAERK